MGCATRDRLGTDFLVSLAAPKHNFSYPTVFLQFKEKNTFQWTQNIGDCVRSRGDSNNIHVRLPLLWYLEDIFALST
jgi:hypothetical protein